MPTLLIIDDDADFRTLIERKFSPLGYEVIAAADGVQGLQMVMSNPSIDLILLDLHMPARDGLETLKMIRSVRPEAKVIIVTAYFDDEAFAKAIAGPLPKEVSAILHKPVTSKDLNEAVQKALGITLPPTRPLG